MANASHINLILNNIIANIATTNRVVAEPFCWLLFAMSTTPADAPKTNPTCQIENVEWFGTWSWQHKFDTCSICKSSIDNACTCEMHDIDNLARCSEIMKGECSHVFHSLCLERWLKVSNVCPLCNQPWRTAFTSD